MKALAAAVIAHLAFGPLALLPLWVLAMWAFLPVVKSPLWPCPCPAAHSDPRCAGRAHGHNA
jgi:hypothetical protein